MELLNGKVIIVALLFSESIRFGTIKFEIAKWKSPDFISGFSVTEKTDLKPIPKRPIAFGLSFFFSLLPNEVIASMSVMSNGLPLCSNTNSWPLNEILTLVASSSSAFWSNSKMKFTNCSTTDLPDS